MISFKFNYKKIVFWFGVVLTVIIIFAGGVWFGSVKFAYHVPQPDEMDFSLFWDSYEKLKDNFIEPEKIDNQKIIHGAISGMAESLGDPYTEFFNPEQARKFADDLSGSFSGIGVEIAIKKEALVVVAPLKGTPGDKAGMRPGDVILKIDDKDAFGLSIDEAVGLIRGVRGTKVKLTIFREDWENSKDIEIIRDIINIPSVEWSIKDGNVAYIQIYSFDGALQNNFKKIAYEILQSPAKKIILDLRRNPGGYLEVARDIAGWFMESGKIVTIEEFGKGLEKREHKTDGNGVFSEYPVVVLIDQGSASASEILAGALRDNRNIKLVGEKSFGKGSVQEIVDLIDGSFLKITIAHWLTPKGEIISEKGLTPDEKIDITENDIEQEKDPQLEKALEIIKTIK